MHGLIKNYVFKLNLYNGYLTTCRILFTQIKVLSYYGTLIIIDDNIVRDGICVSGLGKATLFIKIKIK